MSVRLFFFINLLTFFLIPNTCLHAQTVDSARRAKVAICLPMYLDSAFSGTEYKWAKNRIPSYMGKGLEFYNGVRIAIDSLRTQNTLADIFIVDIKGSAGLEAQLKQVPLQKLDLILGVVTSVNELQLLSTIAYQNSIPFISATYPNDGNIKKNPFLILLNTTLQSHISSLHTYLYKNYRSANIIVCTNKVSLEETIWGYIEKVNNSIEEPLAIQRVFLEDSTAIKNVASYMKKDRPNVCIVGSLNEAFGLSLAKQFSTLVDTYNIKLIGMPTWDGVKAFSGDTYKNLPIIYTSSFNYTNSNVAVMNFKNTYKKTYRHIPRDLLLKGFEYGYHFIKLVSVMVKEDMPINLADGRFKVFNDFDIEPVGFQKKEVDYFENKKIYFIQLYNGQIKILE